MFRIYRTIAIAMLVLAVAPAAFAQRGRVFVRPYAFFGPPALGWYWDPVGYYPYAPLAPATGEVRIDSGRKDLIVYVDGGRVGPVTKFKKMDLTPGNHDIELHDANNQVLFHERVQVLVGRKTDLRSPV